MVGFLVEVCALITPTLLSPPPFSILLRLRLPTEQHVRQAGQRQSRTNICENSAPEPVAPGAANRLTYGQSDE